MQTLYRTRKFLAMSLVLVMILTISIPSMLFAASGIPSADAIFLYPGETETIVSGGNATFTSGDSAVATVDATGVVQAIGVGNTTVKVTGSEPKTVDVTVFARDDYWDPKTYAQIEKQVMENAPQTADVVDDSGNVAQYVYKTVKGSFTAVFDITSDNYKPYVRQADEIYYVSNPNREMKQEVTDYTEAFKAAIKDCSEAGGGTVLVPPGRYYTGAISLLDDVRLHVAEGATVLFMRNHTFAYYPQVLGRYEGMYVMNYSSFLHADSADNVAITGKGVFDGQADNRNWEVGGGFTYTALDGRTGVPYGSASTATTVLYDMNDRRVPRYERLFGEGCRGPGSTGAMVEIQALRPNFIDFLFCNNVLFEDFSLLRSPMWEVHPTLCNNVMVQRLYINSKMSNNDGCNPDCSQNIIIQDVDFNTGDDCIAIKAGRNGDGRDDGIPSARIIVRRNIFRDGHGGVTSGSEMTGGVNNVYAHNNYFDSANLDYPLRFKANSIRGGVIENIYLKDSKVNKSRVAIIHSQVYYGECDLHLFPPAVRNIRVSNFTTAKTEDGGDNNIAATNVLYSRTFGYCPMTGVYLKDCEFNGVTNSPNRNGRSANELACAGDVVWDNVIVNGEIYNPPAASVKVGGIFLGGDDKTGVKISGDSFDRSELQYVEDVAYGSIKVTSLVYTPKTLENANYDVHLTTSQRRNTSTTGKGPELWSVNVARSSQKIVTATARPDIGEGWYLLDFGDCDLRGKPFGKAEVMVRDVVYNEDQDYEYVRVCYPKLDCPTTNVYDGFAAAIPVSVDKEFSGAKVYLNDKDGNLVGEKVTLDDNGKAVINLAAASAAQGPYELMLENKDGIVIKNMTSNMYHTTAQGIATTLKPTPEGTIVDDVVFEYKYLIGVSSGLEANDNIYLYPGDTETLTYTHGAAYASSNNDVATVSASGVITAVGAGSATITATIVATGSVSKTVGVTVFERDDYWDPKTYAEIEKQVMENAPQTADVKDEEGNVSQYVYKTVKGTFTAVFDITSDKYKPYVRQADEIYYVSNPNREMKQEVTDYTEAFKAAIKDCSEAGGGTVLVPPGRYYTGAINLLDDVRLHVAEGATVLFMRNHTFEYYPQVLGRYEGMYVMNYSSFLHADSADNVAITGKGVFDGQADNRNWEVGGGFTYTALDGRTGVPYGSASTATTVLYDMNDRRVPRYERLFGEGCKGPSSTGAIIEIQALRPNFVDFLFCNNVLFEDFSLLRSPMWEVHPTLCNNVMVQRLYINSKMSNNDGCNPDCSQNIIIQDVDFNTGDDCIAIKAGRNGDGRDDGIPSARIIVRRNIFRDGHGGVTSGSEMTGGVNNVYAHNNYFDSTNLDYPLRFKANSIRGGIIENIYLKDSKVNKSRVAIIHSQVYYGECDLHLFLPAVRNIRVSNFTTAGEADGGDNNIAATNVLYSRTFGYCPMTGLYLKDCEFNGVTNSPNRNGRSANELACAGDVVWDNVVVNGEIYNPPAASVKVSGIFLGGDDKTGVKISGDSFDRSELQYVEGVAYGPIKVTSLVYTPKTLENANYDVHLTTSQRRNTSTTGKGPEIWSVNVARSSQKIVTATARPDIGDGWYLLDFGDCDLRGKPFGKAEVMVRDVVYNEDQDYEYVRVRYPKLDTPTMNVFDGIAAAVPVSVDKEFNGAKVYLNDKNGNLVGEKVTLDGNGKAVINLTAARAVEAPYELMLEDKDGTVIQNMTSNMYHTTAQGIATTLKPTPEGTIVDDVVFEYKYLIGVVPGGVFTSVHQEGKVVSSYSNATAEEVSGLFLLAIYKDKVLVDVKADNFTAKASDTDFTEFAVDLAAYPAEEYEYKAFCWGTNYVPLAPPVVIY